MKIEKKSKQDKRLKQLQFYFTVKLPVYFKVDVEIS